MGRFTLWNLERFDPFLIMAEDKFGSDALIFSHPGNGTDLCFWMEFHHKDNKGEMVCCPQISMMTAEVALFIVSPTRKTAVPPFTMGESPTAKKMANAPFQDISLREVPGAWRYGYYIRVYSGDSGHVVSSTKNTFLFTMVEIWIAQVIRTPRSAIRLPFYLCAGGLRGVWHGRLIADTVWGTITVNIHEPVDTSEAPKSNYSSPTCSTFCGSPLNEPNCSRAIFVNTKTNLDQAYADYRSANILNSKAPAREKTRQFYTAITIKCFEIR